MDNPEHVSIPRNQPKVDSRIRIWGYYRKWRDLKWFEWTFLGTAFAFLLACLGLTVGRMVDLSNSRCPDNSTGTIINQEAILRSRAHCGSEWSFAFLILLQILFSMYYAAHGTWWARRYELWAFEASVGLMAAYCVADFIELAQHNHPDDSVHKHIFTIKVSRLAIIGAVLIVGAAVLCFGKGKCSGDVITENRIINNRKPFTHDENDPGHRDSRRIFKTLSWCTFSSQLQASLIILILVHGDAFPLTLLEHFILSGGLLCVIVQFCLVTLSLYLEDKYWAGVASGTASLEVAYIIYRFFSSAMFFASAETEYVSHSLHISVIMCGTFAVIVRAGATYWLYQTAKSTLGNGGTWKQIVYGEPDYQPLVNEREMDIPENPMFGDRVECYGSIARRSTDSRKECNRET